MKAAISEKIDGICTTGTDVAVASVGYVCEHMGLSGISEEAASLVTDKGKMKLAFQKAGVAASDFRKVFSCEEAQKAAEDIGFPVVIKCVDSSGSRGITLVKETGGVFRGGRAGVFLLQKRLYSCGRGAFGNRNRSGRCSSGRAYCFSCSPR